MDAEALLDAAHRAAKHAYAPYSKFHVGAAVLLANGRVFIGCNVENASYGLTICAERNAIFGAVVANEEKPQITAIGVVNSGDVHCPPCGACRQVMAEFSEPATQVFYRGPKGVTKTTMGELLPDSFTSKQLRK